MATKATDKIKKSDSQTITVLEGLEAVRVRPGMYIGSTGVEGMHHILWEIIDNAIDEAANGFADTVKIIINEDSSATIIDNGRGIPVEINPKFKKSGVELVFTVLHAGGKFNNDNYKFSGGLHGVGASVTNALSKWLTVEVHKNKRCYVQKYESKQVGKKFHSGMPIGPLEDVGASKITGTKVSFLPDSAVFGESKFDYEIIVKKIRELAFLNKGIHISFEDKRELDAESERFGVQKFYYKEGLADFMSFLNEGKSILNKKIIYIESKQPDFEVYVAMQYTSSYGENIYSYVNNIHTREGGTHETGFKAGMTRSLNDYIKRNNMGKKDINLTGDDFRDGLTAIVSVKMQNVEFEGQTKTKLGNPAVKAQVESAVNEGITAFLNFPKNKDVGKMIYKKAADASKVRDAERKAKDAQRQKNGMSGDVLVGKFSSCSGKNPERNELFIVEGNSAGGTAKQGRDRSYQAILPLRGKPLNAEKKGKVQVVANEECKTIIYALGTDYDKDFNIKNLKFGKVIILADADQDGGHIASILLTFFYKYMRGLIENGNVYLGMPPLYKIEYKGKVSYAYNDQQMEEITSKFKGNYALQRYKGLGEMNPEQLWDTTMNPATRALTKVTIDDDVEAGKMVSVFMGNNVAARREYILRNAKYNDLVVLDDAIDEEDTVADEEN